jgi:putative two-component system response regulator
MRELMVSDKADIVIVDDQVENLQLLVGLLSPHYNVHPFTDGNALMRYVARGGAIDLILLDVVMPEPDGHAICRKLRLLPEMTDVPIVFLTSLDSMEDETKGLALGAIDYIAKPFSPPIVLARVRNHVRLGRALRLILDQNDLLEHRVAERTAELARKNAALQNALHQVALTQDATIVAFSSLAETRDNETGRHIRRTQNYVRELALAARAKGHHVDRLDDETIDLLYKSASLHDIGKVAIPDHILLKPGRLDEQEFAIMKTHADHGRNAIEVAETSLGTSSGFLRHARDIAYGHHEKWDGTGYPQQLAGESIPLSARIMAIADVYDALVSRRVYKPPMAHHEAAAIISQGHGSHFDPSLVEAFGQVTGRFAEIAMEFADD